MAAPRSRDANYIRSERFIHDDLADRAEAMVDQMRQDWRSKQKIETLAISWPGEMLKTDDGEKLDGAVLMPIPSTFTENEKVVALHHLVTRTKAYGIALVERVGDVLRVRFETKHGARVWTIPLKRHGDVLVPGATEVRSNEEGLGLLWRAAVPVLH